MPTQTHTVTIAQALASTATGLVVADSAATIAGALPNASLTARVASFTVSAPVAVPLSQLLLLSGLGAKLHAAAGALELNSPVTLSAAQLTALEATPGFAMGPAASITLSDTTTNVVALLGAHPAYLGQVTAISVHLDGTSVGAYPASQLNGCLLHGKAVSFVPAGGVLTVAAAAHDLGSNAAALDALAQHQALSFTLITAGSPANIIAADAAGLTTLVGFNIGTHSISVTDSAANIASHAAQLFGEGFAKITVASGTLLGTQAQLLDPTLRFATGAHAELSASATVSGAAAAALAGLPGFSLAQGASLFVQDSAANLAATAPSWSAFAAGAVLSTSAASVSAATLTQLASLPAGLNLAGHSLGVADTLANLTALSSQSAALATSLSLNANATANATQLTAFAALPHASLGGFTIAVTDMASNLIGLSASSLADATSCTLAASATVSTAQFSELRALPGFSAGTSALSVSDTAANLAGLSGNLSQASAFMLSGPANVTASVMTALAGLPHFSTNGYALGVTDTAANLLALSPTAQALAGSATLSQDATVSAAQAAQLSAETGFSTGTHHLSVSDTATNLLALSPTVASLAGTLALSASQSVNAAALTQLAALGASFSEAGHTLTVTDSASNLASLSQSALALAGAEVLAAPATIAAAAAASLAALPNFSLAGQGLTVSDTLANLIALSGPAAALATAITLIGPANVTAAQLTAFAALPHASTGGYTVGVTDTASNLIGLSALSLTDATSCTLASSATVSAAQYGELRALPAFALGGNMLTISDSAASLASLGGNLTLAGAIDLAATATVSAAQLGALSALPGFSLNGNILHMVDTAAQLLTAAPAALALAASVTLLQDATVTAAQAAELYSEPGFSTGAAHLTISDGAANLLALPHSVLVSANTLALSGDQAVSAATLTQLAGLGIKFDEAGHSVTCVDSAANLAGLSQGALSLASAEVLSATATVSAATALALAALPGVSVAAGVILTVQDSVGNLLAAGQSLPAATALVQLAPASMISLTAAQAQMLAAIPHFSAADATITVTDTLANLTSVQDTGWQEVAAAVHVVDTAANLAANAGNLLVQSAVAVSLSANAQVNAGAAAQIAGIQHFAASPFALSVLDTASNIAAHAAAIVQLAAGAIVSDSGPITVATADQLATVSAANLLSFQGGDQLLVQDNYAALTNPLNASGLTLAARLGVLDTAANLTVAAGHNWGALNPTYTLNSGSTITAAQANTLAGLGSHFYLNGYMLSVADSASAVTSAAASVSALGITARVFDTTLNLAANQSGLLGLGASLILVHDTDSFNLSAAAAASISALAAKLVGPALHVLDNAADVMSNLSGLSALGTHVAVSVVDTAADVAPVASGLATLHAPLHVTLTDTTPVAAAVAAALVPVVANLVAGTSLAVTDTAAAIIANAPALAQLGNDLGTITLSDGTTLSAASAAGISSLDSHLATGVMLNVVDTGANVTASEVGLVTLQQDQHLGSITVANTTVSDVTANMAALNLLNAQVTISDTAAAVDTALDELTQVSGLSAITLTDSSPPTLFMTVATLAADTSVLAKIASPYSIAISDTAIDVAADLSAGSASAILSHLSQISWIGVSNAAPLVLTQAQILAQHVDDGAGSALSKFAGAVEVVGVDVAHLAQVAGLVHAPEAIIVADTSAMISADLRLGAGSVLLASTAVVAVTSTDHAMISLTANQVLTAGVDDGASSVLAKLTGATVAVTGATAAQLPALATLNIPAATISVSDTASDIAADLASPGSLLVAGRPTIIAISVQDGQTITLTEQQALAAHVDDGAGSVLSEVTGGALAITHVAASDIAEMLGLSVAPASIAVSDTAAAIVNSLPTIVADLANISGLSVTGGPVSLTAAQTLELHVDDASGSVIDKLAGHAFVVTGASVAQVSQLAALQFTPGSIAIADSSADITADLASGHSALAQYAGLISSIAVTGGTLTLAASQAVTIAASPALNAVFNDFLPTTAVSVTGATVAQFASLDALGWPHLSISVTDTPANIAADLDMPSSVLLANIAALSGVTLNASGTVDAQTLTSMASLPGFSDNGYTLTVQDGAMAIAGLALPALNLATSVAISDTAAHVASTLDALQTKFDGHLSIMLTDAGQITVSAAQYSQDRATIDAITNHGLITVVGTAAQINPIAGQLASDGAVRTVAVTDTAADIISGMSNLADAGAKLVITLTDTTLPASLVAPLLTIAGLPTPTIPVVDTGSQIAQVVESGNTAAIDYLNVNGATLSGNSIVNAADAEALNSLSGLHVGSYTLQVWDTAAHLTSAAYQSALVNANVSGVYLKAPGNLAVVTAATAVALYQIPGFSVNNPPGTPTSAANVLNVSDTAAHIDANFTALNGEVGQVNGLTSITVNASATISEQTLEDLQALGATTGAGVNLTVRDTASTIAMALTATHGSIMPYAWILSGPGAATEAQAVVLGSTVNFNTAGNTISLSLQGNTAISLADAASLGNIASSLNLNGNELIVDGTVAQLSTLSQAALGLITPALADSLPNILALSTTSQLLSGTVEVVGNDDVNAASVEAFLSLVHSGGNAPGIAAANLTFDSSHYVNDSIANLRMLTSSTEWTANQVESAAFTLVARDTLDALINPNNTSFLSGLAATGLSANAVVSAASAASLAGLTGTIHYQADHTITVVDTAANLLNPANSSGLSFSNIVELSGASVLDATDAESLLALPHFDLNTSLTISDSSANLLDGTLANAIANSPYASNIHVQLAGPETLDADTAEALVSLPHFTDVTSLAIADSSSYLLNTANISAEQMATSVTLAGDETVSANTVYRLSQLPHFTPGTSHLELASNDFANAVTLKAIADDGTAFVANGHTITVTEDALDLSPTEFANLQSDNILSNGHVGLLPDAVSITDTGNILSLSAEGYTGGMVQVYNESGSLLSSAVHPNAGFTITTTDAAPGQSFAITETVHGVEGAPVVVLDASAIEAAVTQASGNFASSGGIEIDTNKYVNLYEANAVPQGLTAPALVYSPTAHTVSLDIPGSAPVTLITLGGSTHPASLDLSEIIIKHHG